MTATPKTKFKKKSLPHLNKRENKVLHKNQLPDYSIYDLQAQICGALASPVRLHILDLLADGELTVGDLLAELNIPKANLSQHISVLKGVGVIQARKDGLYHYLSLAIPKIKDACSLVRQVLAEKIENEERKNTELIRELKGPK